MKSNNDVLNAYASADEEERLYLFLSHRDCRQAFMEIDAAGVGDGKAKDSSSKSVFTRGTSLRRAAACCWGWFGFSRG